MAINTTGTPNPKNYLLGRGVVYIAKLDSATGLPEAGFRDLGNAPAFAANLEVEDLTHQSSREGLRVTDKRVIISQTINLSFSIDELTNDNLELFFGGARVTHANQPQSSAVGGTLGTLGGAKIFTANGQKGQWYNLVDDSGKRLSLDPDAVVRGVAAGGGVNFILVEDPAGTPAATPVSEYTLEPLTGRVFIHSDATFTPGISLGCQIGVIATSRATIQIVEALEGSSDEYHVQFVGVNPANNDEPMVYDFLSVKLSPDGDLALIGDEFAQANFTGVAQANVNGDTLEITALSET